MEVQHFEKQPGLVKMHKVATVLMWISWALFFVAMLGTGGYFLVGSQMLLMMLYIIAVAAGGFLLSFLLFSLFSFKLKSVKETGWQLVLTGGFLVMYFLLSIRLFFKGKQMQDGAGYGTIIRQEISELSARVALTIGDAARVFRLF